MDTVSMDTANSNVLHIVLHTVLQVWDKQLQYMHYSMLQYSFLASIRKYPGIHATPGVLPGPKPFPSVSYTETVGEALRVPKSKLLDTCEQQSVLRKLSRVRVADSC